MKKQINIEGMSCEHCVKHVTNAILDLDDAAKVSVDLKGKKAIAEFNLDITDAQLRESIEDAGYDVVSIENL